LVSLIQRERERKVDEKPKQMEKRRENNIIFIINNENEISILKRRLGTRQITIYISSFVKALKAQNIISVMRYWVCLCVHILYKSM
jgi:hypothetical protein